MSLMATLLALSMMSPVVANLPEEAANRVVTVSDAWQVIQEATRNIEELVATDGLRRIHLQEFVLSGAVQVLLDHLDAVAPERREALQRLLVETRMAAVRMHSGGDANRLAQAQLELDVVKRGLETIAPVYPTGALESKRPRGRIHYCPMHAQVTEMGPGNCGRCGMGLLSLQEAMKGTGKERVRTITMVAKPGGPLVVGSEAAVEVSLLDDEGRKVAPADLHVTHTEKLHLLIIDLSLSDYHHVHPKPSSEPGLYTFRFTPRRPGLYCVWADVLPRATNTQEYVLAHIEGRPPSDAIADKATRLTATVEGLRYDLAFHGPLRAGEPVRTTLRISSADGTPFTRLEPLMGAFAHVVGFHEEMRSVSHIHPLGAEPKDPTNRGGPELSFHFVPEKPGFVRMFAQVQIGGVSKFAPFSVTVLP